MDTHLNVERLKEIIHFQPTEKQAHILANLKRMSVVTGGRRVGKSFLVTYIALRELLAGNRKIWIVSPSYGLSKIIWENLLNWIYRHFPETFEVNKATLSIKNKVTGSALELKSADSPISLKGSSGSLLVVDECGDVPDDVWNGYLRPFISEQRPELNGELGRAILIGNASHLGSWFHQLYADESIPNKFTYNLPTAIEDENAQVIASNNPEIVSVEELRLIKQTTPSRTWESQYLAKFLSGNGNVFRGIRECIETKLNLKQPPQAGRRYVMGVDLGRKNDFTVVTVIDKATFIVVYWDRFNVIDWEFQKRKILETSRYYNNARIILDSTGLGDVVRDQLERAGAFVEAIIFTNESKKDLIEKLSLYIEQKKIHYPDIKELISELEMYEYKMTSTGRVVYGAPSGLHDDCVISLSLAVKELGDKPKTFTEIWKTRNGSRLQNSVNDMLEQRPNRRMYRGNYPYK